VGDTEPDRIFIIGASGSGKTTLARTIAGQLGLPLYHLDEIARVGGGNGPERSATERAADVARILASPRWVAEGIHLGWTDGLLTAADTIVWLDHVSSRGASGRIVKRFVVDALAEARRRTGLRRFTRFRDYARQLRYLARAIREARAFHGSAAASGATVDRQMIAMHLSTYSDKVVHCRTDEDVQRFLHRLSPDGREVPAHDL
jgi:adenylate kinase family enzyme